MSRFDRCFLCPRLCRSACPVGTVREAGVPSEIATVLRAYELGVVELGEALAAATLCTDCGACQDLCHLDTPLPAAIQTLRQELIEGPAPQPLEPLIGSGRYIAIESDERSWSQALGAALEEPVVSWRTKDYLGVDSRCHRTWALHCDLVQQQARGRTLVVSDGACAETLTAMGMSFQWLNHLVPAVHCGVGSCNLVGDKPLSCCGAAGPLVKHHPIDADAVARVWRMRSPKRQVDDTRCGCHLNSEAEPVEDAVARLLALNR